MFKPWIGKRYETSGYKGLKILVLGESHYAPNPIFDDFTNEFVLRSVFANEITYPKNSAFCTKIAKIIHQSNCDSFDMDNNEKRLIWESICFYNYIPEQLPAARIAPNTTMWDKAKEPFKQIMGQVAPQAVIVLGNRLWSKACSQTNDFPSVRFIWVKHPSSSRFEYRTAREALREIYK